MGLASDAVSVVEIGAKASKVAGEELKDAALETEKTALTSDAETYITGENMVKGAERTEKYTDAYEAVAHANEAIDKHNETAKQLRELREPQRENPIYRESYDVLAFKDFVDAAGLFPGGGLVKLFAGMIVDIGIANLAGKVSKIR